MYACTSTTLRSTWRSRCGADIRAPGQVEVAGSFSGPRPPLTAKSRRPAPCTCRSIALEHSCQKKYRVVGTDVVVVVSEGEDGAVAEHQVEDGGDPIGHVLLKVLHSLSSLKTSLHSKKCEINLARIGTSQEYPPINLLGVRRVHDGKAGKWRGRWGKRVPQD